MGDLTAALSVAIGAAGGVGLYVNLAIVNALDDAGVLDPLDVARWADYLSANLPSDIRDDAREAIREGIADFAAAIRSVATPPSDTGRA